MTPPVRHSNLTISSTSQQIVTLLYLRVDELVKVIEIILQQQDKLQVSAQTASNY